MEWQLLEDCSPKWRKLLMMLSLPRGVELAEKFVQKTDRNKHDIFHWPCFLKQLTSCTIVTTGDHDVLERTHYSSLPYTVRINLLSLLLRQHTMVGHKELERFVTRLKDEIGTSCGQNWENNLLDRLQELVNPLPINLDSVAAVHLSDKVIEEIANDLSETGVATGSVVSWSSLKEVRSHKRSHNLLSISNEPASKRTKPENDEDGITSSLLIEKSVNSEDVTVTLQPSEKEVSQTEVIQPIDLSSPTIAKIKQLCNNTATLDDKQITLLWEELTSVQIDQLASCLRLIPANEFKEQAVINMLYFIASMPVTVSNKIVECLSTVIVLPYLLHMNRSPSRTFLAAFSNVARKQPDVCIETILTPLLQQKQFGLSHSDFVCTLIREGDFKDHGPSLWRLLVSTSSRECWNDHVISLAQALLDAKVELDKILISNTLQTLLHIAGYMTGNLRFGKLLLALISRHRVFMLDHLEDLKRLATMVTPAFMQRSLQLAINKLEC